MEAEASYVPFLGEAPPIPAAGFAPSGVPLAPPAGGWTATDYAGTAAIIGTALGVGGAFYTGAAQTAITSAGAGVGAGATAAGAGVGMGAQYGLGAYGAGTGAAALAGGIGTGVANARRQPNDLQAQHNLALLKSVVAQTSQMPTDSHHLSHHTHMDLQRQRRNILEEQRRSMYLGVR